MAISDIVKDIVHGFAFRPWQRKCTSPLAVDQLSGLADGCVGSCTLRQSEDMVDIQLSTGRHKKLQRLMLQVVADGIGSDRILMRALRCRCLYEAIKTYYTIHGHRTLKAPHPVRSAQLTRVPPS